MGLVHRPQVRSHVLQACVCPLVCLRGDGGRRVLGGAGGPGSLGEGLRGGWHRDGRRRRGGGGLRRRVLSAVRTNRQSGIQRVAPVWRGNDLAKAGCTAWLATSV